MRHRHPRFPLPRVWLMTDERIGDALFDVIAALPRGSGIIVRHYRWTLSERRALFRAVQQAARRGGHLVLRAGRERLGGVEAGVHGPWPTDGVRTMAAHNRREVIRARLQGADAALLSPVYATRSHPGGNTLGIVRFGLAMHGAGLPVIALGGMTARRAHVLSTLNIHGWAAIDAWRPAPKRNNQKRNAVPI